MVANAWLRPGDTADSSSCKEFMEETFNEVLKNKRVGLVRADSGFCTQGLLEYLESKQLNYIIAARMHPNVKNAVWG